jgi:hypothetical protein
LGVLALCVVLAAGCRGVALPGNVDGCRQALMAMVPNGSGIDAAKHELERLGLRCSEEAQQRFYDLREGSNPVSQLCQSCLVCESSSSEGFMVSRRWHVGIEERNGTVGALFVTIDLDGP